MKYQNKFPKAIIIGSSDAYLEFFNYALEIASLKVKTSVTAIEGDAVARKTGNKINCLSKFIIQLFIYQF